MVVRPGIVYGEGRGLPAMFATQAREDGVARTIGDGANHWPVVHVDDCGDLYVLALKKGEAGNAYDATDDSAFTQKEIAQAASVGAGRDGSTVAWPVEEAVAALGEWAQNLALDQRVSSAKAKRDLRWNAKRPSILEDLARGSYAQAAVG
jgi:nucleoside-diphosphate-sugar epimerase